MSDNLQVPREFLAEEELGQTMPKSKKKRNGGPYPLQAKKKRRDEVFRLHFDYGYSARKIADMLKINRNTINSDIAYCYSGLQREDSMMTIQDWVNKMIYRLETKRVRIMEKLDKAVELQEFLLLEKMLYEVDAKIVQVVMKMQTTEQMTYDRTISMLNDWLEEHGYRERYVLWGQTLKVTSDTSNRITQMIQSDKHQRPLRRDRYDPHSRAASQEKF